MVKRVHYLQKHSKGLVGERRLVQNLGLFVVDWLDMLFLGKAAYQWRENIAAKRGRSLIRAAKSPQIS